MNWLKLEREQEPVTEDLWQVKAHIAVASCKRDAEGKILLSAECVTAKEVEYWANELIKELNAIKRKANAIRWHNHPGLQADR